MKRPLSSRERKLLSVAGLAALTLAGHLAVSRLDAHPSGPTIPGPVAGPGVPAPGPIAAPADGGPVRLSARLDRGAVFAGAPGEVRVEVTLAGERDGASRRRPTDFYVVLDRSGSMEGDKIAHARTAVLQLIDQLGPDDRFALVSYASEARVDVTLAAATSADPELGARRWKEAVRAIEASGGTAMSMGLDLALDQAGARRPEGRSARLLLLSDGLANEGDFSPRGPRGAFAASRRRIDHRLHPRRRQRLQRGADDRPRQRRARQLLLPAERRADRRRPRQRAAGDPRHGGRGDRDRSGARTGRDRA